MSRMLRNTRIAVFAAVASWMGVSCTAFTDVSELVPEGDNGGNTCEAQIDCVEFDDDPATDHICGADNTCIELDTDLDCELFDREDQRNESGAIVIGSIIPKSDQAQRDTFLSRENAIRLAIDEINDSGGVSGGRSILLVGCSDNRDVSTGLDAASFLIDDLGVPAIIGPTSSSIFTSVVTDYSAPNLTFTISPSATSTTITTLPDSGMAWRTAASDVEQGSAIAQYIQQKFPAANGNNIVAINTDDDYGNDLAAQVGSKLDGTEYAFTSIAFAPESTTFDDLPTSAGDANVVVVIATSQAGGIIKAFQDAGSTASFILSDGAKTPGFLTELSGVPADFLGKVEGIDPLVSTPGVTDEFNRGYIAESSFSGVPGNYAAHAYDATFVVAYAIAAVGENIDVTGVAIRDNMNLLVGGPQSFNVGESDIAAVRSLLTEGSPVDLVGASGSLDFDVSTGDVPSDYGLWRLQSDSITGNLIFVPGGRWSVTDSWEFTPRP